MENRKIVMVVTEIQIKDGSVETKSFTANNLIEAVQMVGDNLSKYDDIEPIEQSKVGSVTETESPYSVTVRTNDMIIMVTSIPIIE